MLRFRAYFAWKDLEWDKNCKLLHIYISELQNLGVEMTAPNSTLHYDGKIPLWKCSSPLTRQQQGFLINDNFNFQFEIM